MAAGSPAWQAVAQWLRARQLQPCWICNKPIDYSRPHRNPITNKIDPLSFSADHYLPTNQGGLDTRANARPTHLGCNCARHDNAPVKLTSRRW